MTDPLPHSSEVPAPAPRRRLSRRRVLLWVTLVFLVTLLLAGLVLYTQRLSVIESMFRTALAERGLDADLTVDEFTADGLQLSNVTLRENGQIVLRARKVRAGYNLREALDGQIKTIAMEGARIRVGVDENFKIVDGWLQPNPDGGGVGLPYEGVTLTDSAIDLITPYGDLDLGLEADIATIDRFTANLELAPAQLTREALSARLSGPLELSRNGDTLTATSRLSISELDYEEFSARDGTLDFGGDYGLDTRRFAGSVTGRFADGRLPDGRWSDLQWTANPLIDLTESRIRGPISASLASIDHAQLAGDTLTLSSDSVDLRFANGVQARGDYALSAATLAAFDIQARAFTGYVTLLSDRAGTARLAATSIGFTPARARELADTLSLRERFEATTITRDFALSLRDALAGALSSGPLEIDATADFTSSHRLTLNAPGRFAGLSLSPVTDAPTYLYDPDTGDLQLRLSGRMGGPRVATLSDIDFQARSENGLTPDVISRFTARARTGEWRAQTPDGRETILDPLNARVDFSPARTRLSGGLGFTGDIPGGYVSALSTEGELVITPGGRVRLDYATDAPLTFDRLLLASGARVEDFTAQLMPGAPVLIGDAANGTIDATLKDARFTYLFELEDGTPEVVDIESSQIKADGKLQGGVQDWDLRLTNMALASDTFIGPGTSATTPDVRIEARLSESPLSFRVETDALDANTELASVRAIPVSAEGTLGDFQTTFGPGKMKAENPAVPIVSLEGQARFTDGAWQGRTDASLPGNSKPLDVTFTFADRAGTADVIVDDLTFSPDGLQPQTYVQALRGKVSRVEGAVDGRFDLAFGIDQPLKSSGFIILDGLDVGTAPGPADGLRGRINIESLFPLQTSGRQTLTLDSFDPGLPLENGVIDYELIPEGVKIYSAVWPFGDGQISLDPLTWLYGAEVNRATLVVQDVGVADFLEAFGQGKIEATGVLSGRLPVEVRGVNVEVRNGSLSVPSGGVIRYTNPQTDTAAAQSETSKLVFDALKEFRYETFGLEIDGPLDGEITVRISFFGQTPDSYTFKKSQPGLSKPVSIKGPFRFKFNIAVTGELFNIARSFNTNAIIENQLLQQLGETPENTENSTGTGNLDADSPDPIFMEGSDETR